MSFKLVSNGNQVLCTPSKMFLISWNQLNAEQVTSVLFLLMGSTLLMDDALFDMIKPL